jgi:two-component system response regulator MprA
MEHAVLTTDVRILVADDDSGIRKLLREVLSDHGYTVDLAVDGVEALTLARANPPAVVLMDLMMPSLSGGEATNALKADPTTAAIPVVAMSAGRNLALMAAGIPADDFVSKPFDLPALFSTLVYLTRRSAPL